MLFRNTLFLSIPLISFHIVSAVNVGPLLAARQTSVSQCQSECSTALNLAYGGGCDITCVCSTSTLNVISQCLQCAAADNIPATGFDSGSVQSFESQCSSAGYPVSINTAGSPSSTAGSTPSVTGLGGGGGATASPATATGGPGGNSTNSTTTAIGGQPTATTGTTGKSSATDLTARLGAVAAAVVLGVVILAA